jgi:hypothetical protein
MSCLPPGSLTWDRAHAARHDSTCNRKGSHRVFC